MTTAAEMKAKIEAAIIDITDNGQEVKWANGVVYTKANLTELRALLKEYTVEAAGSASSNPFFGRAKTIIPRRS